MEAAFGRLHNGGRVDGEPANIAKTYANMYQIFADLYILPISSHPPYVAPGAIQLAQCTALCDIYPSLEDPRSRSSFEGLQDLGDP